MFSGERQDLWRAWIWANAWAEFLGLGGTFTLGYGIFAFIPEPKTPLAMLGFILLMTATGILEGTIVGWFQWRVLRRRFQDISLKSWWMATLIGALTAWFLGSLPSSIMSLGADASEGVVLEPPMGLVLLLACVMGLVLGVILAYPQWRVLRRYANRAWLWLPANSLAWGVGMAIIFVGIDLAQRLPGFLGLLGVMGITLLVTGAVVGAIHGAFLIRLELKT